MVKRLTKHGNSLALVIDRGVLDLLDIDADTPLSIRTDGKCLIVTPIQDETRQKKFHAALEKVDRQYSRAFKKLAE
jgi:antitoxin component of MazEF toxin-antitoxin module